MTADLGLLICAAAASLATMGVAAGEAGRESPSGDRILGLALIAVALWLTYAAGGA